MPFIIDGNGDNVTDNNGNLLVDSVEAGLGNFIVDNNGDYIIDGNGNFLVDSIVAVPSPVGLVKINSGGAAYQDWIADTAYSGISHAFDPASIIDITNETIVAPEEIYKSVNYVSTLESIVYVIESLEPNELYLLRLFFYLNDELLQVDDSVIQRLSINGMIPILYTYPNPDEFIIGHGDALETIVTADPSGIITIVITPETLNLSAARAFINGVAYQQYKPALAPLELKHEVVKDSTMNLFNLTNFALGPNALKLAQGVNGFIETRGEIRREGFPLRYIEDSSLFSGVDRYSFFTRGFRKIAGANNQYDAPLLFNRQTHPDQPFQLGCQLVREQAYYQSGVMGFTDSSGSFNGVEFYNYGGTGWLVDVFINYVRVRTQIRVNALSVLKIVWDGSNVSFLVAQNGVWTPLYQTSPVNKNVQFFQAYWNMLQINTTVQHAWVGIEEVITPILAEDTVDILSSQNITVWKEGRKFWLRGTAIETAQLTARVIETNEEATANIQIEALRLQPKSAAIRASGIVIEGKVIEFETNAAGGTFSASKGVVTDELTWLAPPAVQVGDQFESVLFEYEINDQRVFYNLMVVPELIVQGAENGFFGWVEQGTQIQFHSTDRNARYECFTDPALLSSRGLLHVPFEPDNDVFGYKELEIVVSGLGQEVRFFIKVYPIYPIPQYQGVVPTKWQRKVPDRKPVKTEFEGGGMEASNNTILPVQIINVTYDNLSVKEHAARCKCQHCDSIFVDTVRQVHRLDQFEELVKGIEGRFTVIDHHTGEKLSPFRLTKYEGDHNDYRIGQRRTVEPYFPAR